MRNFDFMELFVFALCFFVAGMYATWFMYAPRDITHRTKEPYCQTAYVLGEEVKRCLKAVEVDTK